MKDLGFFMEKDLKFKFKGKPTYKLAVADFGEFQYLKRLIDSCGWTKNGACYHKQ